METRWVMIPLPIQREIQLPIQRGIHVAQQAPEERPRRSRPIITRVSNVRIRQKTKISL